MVPVTSVTIAVGKLGNIRGRSLDLRAPGTSVVTKVFISGYSDSLLLVVAKVSGEANKIHMANSNSSEPNVRVGVEEVSKWKTGEVTKWKNDVAS